MELDKIKVGKTYPYRSKAHEGRGKVERIKTEHSDGRPMAKGAYVELFDSERDKHVRVRASQVG